MRRRDFVLAAASVAGAAVPRLARSAMPCPPATFGVGGGSSAVTSCGSSSGYTTNFPLTENPISESGRWAQQGKLTALDWNNVRTGGGVAFGTQTGAGGYDDSIALLSGFSPDQRISGIISLTGSRSTSTSTHEVELLLRGSLAVHEQHFYECLIGYSGDGSLFYVDIIRQNGSIGDFTSIGQSQVSTPLTVNHGDQVMAQIVGSSIQLFHNGKLLVAATDSTYVTGQPGIGFFWRGTENQSDFSFSSITANNR